MFLHPIPVSSPSFWEVTKNMLFPNAGNHPPQEQEKKIPPNKKEEEEQQQITAGRDATLAHNVT